MATPQSSKFQYSTEPAQKSVQTPVVEEKEPKFSFDFMEKDTDSGVELDENFFNLAIHDAIGERNSLSKFYIIIFRNFIKRVNALQ